MTALQLPQVPHEHVIDELLDSPASELVTEYRELLERFQAKAESARVLASRRDQARAQDREEQAAALRAGEPDPGDGHQEQLEAELAAAQREAEALATATRAAYSELKAKLASDVCGTWVADLIQERHAARKRLGEACDQLANAISAIDRADFLVSYVERATDPENPRMPGSHLPTPAAINMGGRPELPESLLEHLRRYRQA